MVEFFGAVKVSDMDGAIREARRGYERRYGEAADMVLVNPAEDVPSVEGVEVVRWEKMPRGMVGATRRNGDG